MFNGDFVPLTLRSFILIGIKDIVMARILEEAHVCEEPLAYGRNEQPLYVAPWSYMVMGSLLHPWSLLM